MKFEIDNLIVAFEVLKDNFKDMKEVQGWFEDEHLPHESDYSLTRDDALMYACAYHEHRIHNKQMFDLLRLYISEFEGLIQDFKALDIEKASSDGSLPTKSDNA
ncbi:type II toxin-antitoxin system toxin TscT [Staphylococcus cohnii]|uniref:type II toxin-antitoxin system toxin TscT n=1 Tax=Staphylococcus cohnii TaxID=29382 RepID=UPI003D7EC00C